MAKRKKTEDCNSEEETSNEHPKRKVKPEDEESVISELSPVVNEIAWSEPEICTLIKNVEIQLPEDDRLPYSRRISKLNWEKIKFGSYDAEDCKKKFTEILLKQRRHRLCSEILEDMKEWVKNPGTENYSSKKPKHHPDMPLKPLSSYMLFYQDKVKKLKKQNPQLPITHFGKIIGEMFRALPEEKKEKYKRKAEARREEYNEKILEFYQKHPDEIVQKKAKSSSKRGGIVGLPNKPLPPFKIFYQWKENKHKNDPDFDPKKLLLKCKEHWYRMSDAKKATWIKWVMEKEEEFLVELEKFAASHPDVDVSKYKPSVIKKEERAVLDRLSGKPKMPPRSTYSYFCATAMAHDSYHSGKTKLKDIGERWRSLSDSEKKQYEDKLKELHDQYKKDLEKYLESLPPEKRALEMENLSKKEKKPALPSSAEKNQPSIEKWIQKKVNEVNGANVGTLLYKNEPPEPPGTVFDYYEKKFSERHKDLSEEVCASKAKVKWEKMSDEKKNKYEEELKELKNRFIKEYKAFLKNLNEKELEEYAMVKKQRKKSDQDSEESDTSSSDGSDDSDNSGKSSDES